MLKIEEIVNKIEREECFSASLDDLSISISIDDYVPYVCAAIHNGHQLRENLQKKIALSEDERWYEEDPHTADFIKNFPITIVANDSRFEYDLNRSAKYAIYQDAWGKQVWSKSLTAAERKLSLEKHSNFYRIIDTLIKVLERKFKNCLVFDIHSYNYKRIESDTPVFNLGTECVDQMKYQTTIEYYLNKLNQVEVSNTEEVKAKANEVFFGRGYFLKHITERFSHTLVLATEIKKIYCDELSGELFPLVIDEIQKGMHEAILFTAKYFVNQAGHFTIKRKAELLASNIDPQLKDIDRKLYRLVKNFEVLSYVNPNNLETEKKRFYKAKFIYTPEFRYKQIDIHPFFLKRDLHNLPLENIDDPNIRHLYEDVISSYTRKIDLLSSINSREFLDHSIHYFGAPFKSDVDNAKFLLHLKSNDNEEDNDELSDQDALELLKKVSRQYGFDCQIKITDHIVAKALVLNSKKTVLIKKKSRFSRRALHALAHHEIGVHMVTTQNSLRQPLKLFHIGLPLNTETQEGLAICSEYFSGFITIKRLKELAYRVLAIDSMIHDYNFSTTFHMLKETYGLDPDTAFSLCARVYRGGGFTKDYLYLSGFQKMLNLFNQKKNIAPLLIGKTNDSYYVVIKEMIDRGYLESPRYMTKSFIKPKLEYDEINLLVQSLV